MRLIDARTEQTSRYRPSRLLGNSSTCSLINESNWNIAKEKKKLEIPAMKPSWRIERNRRCESKGRSSDEKGRSGREARGEGEEGHERARRTRLIISINY